jgi:hypothetical protein
MHPATRDRRRARARVCVCVTTPPFYKANGPQHSPTSGGLCNETEEEDYKEEVRLRLCDKHLHNGNHTLLKNFISCKPIFVCITQVFWVVARVDG